MLQLRLRSLFLRSKVDGELEEELQYHVDRQMELEIAAGRTPEEARYAALQSIRDIQQRKEECRDARRVRWLEDLLQDLKFAVRTLRKTPGFTAITVLVLVLGIGANTAVFTVVNDVLLRPLPYPEPDRLFLLSAVPKNLIFTPGPIMVDRDYLDFRPYNHSFESLATLGSSGTKKVTLTCRGDPENLNASLIGSDFLRVLRVNPELGRGFLPDGPSDPNVVLLSHQLWISRFAGDPKTIGHSIVLDGVSYSIVGVMPADFTFLNADLWIRDEVRLDSHNVFFYPVVGRLKPGISLSQAQAELMTFAATRRSDHELNQHGFTVRILPLRDLFVAGVRTLLLIFAAAVALVLVIACANFANLLLIRGSGRQPEIAVRAALGASRWRLVRQLITESTLLSLGGASLGLLLSVVFRKAILALLPPQNIPPGASPYLDVGVLAFAFGLSLATGVLFGLAPALQATGRDLRERVSEGGRNLSLRRERLRSGLVISEIALALVLLVGAGLLVRSFLRMRSVDLGFDSRGVVTATVALPAARYRTAAQMRAFDERMLLLLKSLPGAQSVAAVSFPPFGSGVRGDFQIEGGRRLPEHYQVDKPVISPEYFRTMGIRLLSGRSFTEQDHSQAPGVVMISESVARRLWPAGGVLGKRISMEDHPKPEDWLMIVGVAADVRQQGLNDKQSSVVYLPYQQINVPGFLKFMSFVVRSDNAKAMGPGIRAMIHSVDRELAPESVTTMDTILANARRASRSQTRLLGIFSFVALGLAAIGIYGVLSCSVAERTHEMGIRLAVGAEQKNILWLVFRRSFALAASGILLGLAGSLVATRWIGSLLFEVKANDPMTYAGVTAVLVAVTLAASYLPARRAAQLDPMVALRQE
jgi:putative ABC transport system permease protein